MKIYNYFFLIAIVLLTACGEDANNDPLDFTSGKIWMGVGERVGQIDRIVQYDYVENSDNHATINMPSNVYGTLKTVDDRYNEAVILSSDASGSSGDNAKVIFMSLTDGKESEVAKFPMTIYPDRVYSMQYFPNYNKTYLVTNHGSDKKMKLFSLDRKDLDTIQDNSGFALEAISDELAELLDANSLFLGANFNEEKLLVCDTLTNELYEYSLRKKNLDAIGSARKEVNSSTSLTFSSKVGAYVGAEVSVSYAPDSSIADMKLKYVSINRENGSYTNRAVLNMSKKDYNLNYDDSKLSKIHTLVDEQAGKLLVVLPRFDNSSQIVTIDLAAGTLVDRNIYNFAVSGIARVKNR
ncbi:MAG: hypothetical protein ACK5L5_06040 [Bacteroidales bacterium]